MIALERALRVSRGLLCRLLPRAHVLTSLGEHVAPHLGPTHLSLHCCRRLRLLRIPAQYAAAVGAHRSREPRLRDDVRRGAGLPRVLDELAGRPKTQKTENVRTALALHYKRQLFRNYADLKNVSVDLDHQTRGHTRSALGTHTRKHHRVINGPFEGECRFRVVVAPGWRAAHQNDSLRAATRAPSCRATP